MRTLWRVSDEVVLAPRRPWRAPGVARVAFLFGMTGRPALSGTELRGMLGDLGTSPDSVRALLARMVRAGQLATTRHGREVDYRLAGPFADDFVRIRDRRMNRPAPWPGYFHALLYTVPERHREFRNTLRREAVLVGYGLATPGVLISTRDASELLAPVLDRRPAAAIVWNATVSMTIGDAAAAASQAWDLPGLARIYRAHDRRLHRTGIPGTPTRTFRTFVTTLMPMFVDRGRQPSLPVDLMPADWPGPELDRSIARFSAAAGPMLGQYLKRIHG